MAIPIENRPINGLTWRTAVIVLLSTITTCATGLAGYYGIIHKIDESNTRSAMNEIAIREMRVRLDKVEVDVQQLREQYYQLSYKK